MAHALSVIKGTYNEKEWCIGIQDNGTKIIATYDEIISTHWENKVRAEHNLPLRTHYFYETGNATLLLDTSGRSLYMDCFEDTNFQPIILDYWRYNY